MKNLRSLSLAALFAGCLSFAADSGARTVGSGKVTSETRETKAFTGVDLAGTGTAEITPGKETSLTIEAEDNILPLIETTVKSDGTLLITFKNGENIQPTKPITYKLTTPNLDKLTLSGSGKIHAAGRWSNDRTSIALPSSGNIAVDDLKTTNLTVSVAGSGTVTLAGGAPGQNVKISGSGNYEAEAFRTDAATVSISGSGDCQVWAEKTLDASISGSGAVKYRGAPELKQRVSGSGSIRAMGSKAI